MVDRVSARSDAREKCELKSALIRLILQTALAQLRCTCLTRGVLDWEFCLYVIFGVVAIRPKRPIPSQIGAPMPCWDDSSQTEVGGDV